jgi:hypothetical protein
MKIKILTHTGNLPAGEYEFVEGNQDRRTITLRRGSETKEATVEALEDMERRGALLVEGEPAKEVKEAKEAR